MTFFFQLPAAKTNNTLITPTANDGAHAPSRQLIGRPISCAIEQMHFFSSSWATKAKLHQKSASEDIADFFSFRDFAANKQKTKQELPPRHLAKRFLNENQLSNSSKRGWAGHQAGECSKVDCFLIMPFASCTRFKYFLPYRQNLNSMLDLTNVIMKQEAFSETASVKSKLENNTHKCLWRA